MTQGFAATWSEPTNIAVRSAVLIFGSGTPACRARGCPHPLETERRARHCAQWPRALHTPAKISSPVAPGFYSSASAKLPHYVEERALPARQHSRATLVDATRPPLNTRPRFNRASKRKPPRKLVTCGVQGCVPVNRPLAPGGSPKWDALAADSSIHRKGASHAVDTMTMIKCPECQMQVSDKAPSCPHCGVPGEELVAAAETQRLEAERREQLDAERREREAKANKERLEKAQKAKKARLERQRREADRKRNRVRLGRRRGAGPRNFPTMPPCKIALSSISQQLLQPGVVALELLEPPCLIHPQAAVLLAPPVLSCSR